MAQLYGYARVSSADQDLSIQQTALKAAGCRVIRSEKASGTSRNGRTELEVLLEFLRAGDTLVVTTANFRPMVFRSASEKLKLTEKFLRVDADTLLYEFTVDDPLTWTKPWTVQFPMTRMDEPVYEYACHEGNYSLPNILKGARAAER